MNESNLLKLFKILGIKNVKRVDGSLMASCPFAKYKRPDGSKYHKGTDRNPSFGVSLSSPSLYNCFGCAQNGLLSFLPTNLSFASGKDYNEARDFILRNDTVEFEEYDTVIKKEIMPAINEEALKKLPLVSDKNKLGLSKNVIDYFELKYYTKDERLIIPIRDNFGRLVAIKGRYIGSNEYRLNNDKFTFYKGNGVKRNGIWYGMNQPLVKDKALIVGESESDHWALYSTGLVSNIWSSLGANVTEAQIFNLQQVTNPVILFFDNDKAGKDTTNKLIKKLKGLMPLYKVTNYYGEKDIRDLIKHKKINKALSSIKRI